MKGLNLSECPKYISSVNNITIIYTSLTRIKKKISKFIEDAIPSHPVFLQDVIRVTDIILGASKI